MFVSSPMPSGHRAKDQGIESNFSNQRRRNSSIYGAEQCRHNGLLQPDVPARSINLPKSRSSVRDIVSFGYGASLSCLVVLGLQVKLTTLLEGTEA